MQDVILLWHQKKRTRKTTRRVVAVRALTWASTNRAAATAAASPKSPSSTSALASRPRMSSHCAHKSSTWSFVGVNPASCIPSACKITPYSIIPFDLRTLPSLRHSGIRICGVPRLVSRSFLCLHFLLFPLRLWMAGTRISSRMYPNDCDLNQPFCFIQNGSLHAVVTLVARARACV